MIVDIIVIAILILAVLYGYNRGLVKVAVGFCATIISIIATMILYLPISNLIINTTNIDETIQNAIYEKATSTINNKKSDENNYVGQMEEKLVEDAKNGILPQTARSLAINAVNIGVMVILFIAIKIIVSLISALADALADLPIIKQFNKAGGIIYGLLIGLIIIFIGLEIIQIVSTVNPANPANEYISKSLISKELYKNNIINLFLEK